jgi:hypothetical protein
MANTNDFTPPKISTITATTELGCGVDIISVAKYLAAPSKDVVGLKLVYAGGNSHILRGSCRPTKTSKGFQNQLTFLLDVGGALVHCKVFHNGSLQITGALCVDKILDTWEKTLSLLSSMRGWRSVELKSTRDGVLVSYDHLMYASSGDVIGWADPGTGGLHMNGPVNLEDLDGHKVLVTARYHKHRKEIFTLDGHLIGERRLVFDDGRPRRNTDVRYGYLYRGNAIIGREVTTLVAGHADALADARRYREEVIATGRVLRHFSALAGPALPVTESSVLIHMVNMHFAAPFRVCREKVHSLLLRLGYYSRLEPCNNPGVNFLYYVGSDPRVDPAHAGICRCANKALCCSCKVISIRLFNSGKAIVTGLKSVSQSEEIFEVVKRFYTMHRDLIAAVDETSRRARP